MGFGNAGHDHAVRTRRNETLVKIAEHRKRVNIVGQGWVEGAGIAGVICGRALYDGRVDPAQALAILSG